MGNQPLMTIRAARVNSGYSAEEAAALIGLQPEELRELERDSTDCTVGLFAGLCRLYGVSVDQIHVGEEREFHQKQRAANKREYAAYVHLTASEFASLTELFGAEERDRRFLAYAAWISGRPRQEQLQRSAYLTMMDWHQKEQADLKQVSGGDSDYARTKSVLVQEYEEALQAEAGGRY